MWCTLLVLILKLIVKFVFINFVFFSFGRGRACVLWCWRFCCSEYVVVVLVVFVVFVVLFTLWHILLQIKSSVLAVYKSIVSLRSVALMQEAYRFKSVCLLFVSKLLHLWYLGLRGSSLLCLILCHIICICYGSPELLLKDPVQCAAKIALALTSHKMQSWKGEFWVLKELGKTFDTVGRTITFWWCSSCQASLNSRNYIVFRCSRLSVQEAQRSVKGGRAMLQLMHYIRLQSFSCTLLSTMQHLTFARLHMVHFSYYMCWVC